MIWLDSERKPPWLNLNLNNSGSSRPVNHKLFPPAADITGGIIRNQRIVTAIVVKVNEPLTNDGCRPVLMSLKKKKEGKSKRQKNQMDSK